MMTMGVDDATLIGVEGYTYLFPLVLMQVTKDQMTNVAHAGDAPMRGPVGAFVHARAFPPADFRDVVRPNFDTLYSTAWVDLSEEPTVLEVPDAGDLFYLLPMYNMFGEVFASPGTRTLGNAARRLFLTGPDWVGEVPSGMVHIPCNHTLVWIIGRTQASASTYERVHAFQDGLAVRPLSLWEAGAPARVVGSKDPGVDDVTPPVRQVLALDAADFFARAADLLRRFPGYVFDRSVQLRLEQVGLRAGEPFDLTAAAPQVQAGLSAALPIARKRITDHLGRLGVAVNGWRLITENMGSFGQDYLQRATVELMGLGANLPEDSIYPLTSVDADGQPYTGEHAYRLRFEAGALPPAHAFWSLTLYDGEGFVVANPLNRFAIGNRDPLPYNPDGSLDLLIRHEPPGPGDESRWLPAPAGSFNLCLRIYWPTLDALDGAWLPPAVQRI